MPLIVLSNRHILHILYICATDFTAPAKAQSEVSSLRLCYFPESNAKALLSATPTKMQPASRFCALPGASYPSDSIPSYGRAAVPAFPLPLSVPHCPALHSVWQSFIFPCRLIDRGRVTPLLIIAEGKTTSGSCPALPAYPDILFWLFLFLLPLVLSYILRTVHGAP